MLKKLLLVVLMFLPLLATAQQPITLSQAVEMAVERNPLLQAAEEEAAAAEARLGQVRSARAPRFDFSQGFTRGNNQVYVFGTLLTQRQFSAADFALSRLNAPRPLDNFQTRLDGQLMLFDSGRTRWQLAGARRAKTATDYQTEQARQDLILRVIEAYSAILVARQDAEAAREALRTAESNEQQVGALEKAGMVVTSDLLSAQVFRAQMKDRELRAENALDLARFALGRELGLPPESLREPAGKLREPAPLAMNLDDWERVALAERPVLRAAEQQQQAAVANRQFAKAEFGPRLDIFANFERDAETLAGPSGANWTAGAKLDINLFAGGANRYRLAEAEAHERQAGKNLEWLRSGVRLEVRQAWLDSLSAAQRASTARDAAGQARESLRIIQSRYQAGLVTITELLRAQLAQLEARTAHVAALGDWQRAHAQLEHAAGRLTPDSELLRSELP